MDCGATGLFMDKKFAEGKGFTLQTLDFPIKVRNVDGTWNKGGEITQETSVILEYDYHEERLTFEICDLGKNEMILGMTWLNKHNPEIDWETGHVKMTRCPRSCGRHAKEYKRKRAKERLRKRKATKWELWEYVKAKEEEHEFVTFQGGNLDFIRSKDERYQDEYRQINKTSTEDLVPQELHEFLTVFNKEKSERMPLRKPWDHSIELKDSFIPKKSKIYSMSPEEQKEISDFVTDQMRK